MTAVEALIQEIKDVPEPLAEQVLRFTRKLKALREAPGMDNAFASEDVLARDWLSPEEDEAWADL